MAHSGARAMMNIWAGSQLLLTCIKGIAISFFVPKFIVSTRRSVTTVRPRLFITSKNALGKEMLVSFTC